MVTSLFNLGGSGGGVTEERVLELIASSGAPIYVEYQDIDTALALEIYNHPEKYVIKKNNLIYSYNYGLTYTENSYKVFSNVSHNIVGADANTYQRYLYVKDNGEVAVLDNDTMQLNIEIVNYEDIDTTLGMRIYNNPENYIVKHNNLLYRFEDKDSNSVGFIAKTIFSGGASNVISFSEYYFEISNTGEKTEIDIFQNETYNKRGIDNKIGDIETLLSEI